MTDGPAPRRTPDPADDDARLPRPDRALLEAAAWLAAHPANADGSDKTFVLRALRRMQRLLGRPVWPPHAEERPTAEELRRWYGEDADA